MRALSLAAGVACLLTVLFDAFQTIILPRRATGRFRLTRIFYIATWNPWVFFAKRIPNPRKRETAFSYYGPLSLIFLLVVWAAAMVLGFALVFYSLGSPFADPAQHAGFRTDIYVSGTTVFTLGLGDVLPQGPWARGLLILEAGTGFGFLAVVMGYFPVLYSAFSRREVSIALLDARAGSPPTAVELLRRHSGPHGQDALRDLLHNWERWSAQILESHVSYPVVSYFRSQHSNESWLAALATILDVSALLISNADDACSRQARLTFAMCRHTVVDLAQVFYRKPLIGIADRLPPEELKRMRAALKQSGFEMQGTEAADNKLAHLREMYEPYLQALAAHLYLDLPPWILSKEITDNWRTSAWGRISGFSAARQEEVTVDDHSD